jgi:cyclase
MRYLRGSTMRKITLVAFAAACFAVPALAQQPAPPGPPVGPDWSKIEVKTFDLGNRTFMLEGFGGNTTIAVGEDGVIMVDGQYAPMHDKLKTAIAAHTQQPVRFLVNTHYHPDHVGGNIPFGKDGAVIVAHENMRKRLAEGTTRIVPEVKYAPAPEEALPSITHKDGMTLRVQGRAAQLKYAPNAHTDGDTYVYFADANVLSTGDVVAMERYPNIDFTNGGSLKGMIAACEVYLALASDDTKIVPGHGPLATKAQLAEYRTMLSTIRERMVALVKEGKSEADVLAAKPFADFDAKLKVNDQASANWTRVVYGSVKSE